MSTLTAIPRRWAGWLARALLLAAVVLGPQAAPPARADSTAVVRCRAGAAVVAPGLTTTLYIEIVDVAGLYGYQLDVHYDQAKIEVLDGGGATGVNFVLGGFISPDFILRNEADNGTGQAELAVTQTQPHTAQSGSGELAHVSILGLSTGQANFTLDEVILSTIGGSAIPHSVENCSTVVGIPRYLPLVFKEP